MERAPAPAPAAPRALFPCSVCARVYTNRQNLKRHAQRSCGTAHTCPTCHAAFNKKYKLTAHLYKHTGLKSFRCEFCSKCFVTLYEKRKHMAYHKSYECDQCTETFQRWSKYQEHRKQLHKTKVFVCDECGRSFRERAHILRHLKLHSAERGAVRFMCPAANCTKFYTTKYNLKQHTDSAHHNKTYDCSLCQARRSTKASLKQHMRSHAPGSERTAGGGRGPPPTLSTGRRGRRDRGVLKGSVALRLAGVQLASGVPERAGDSRLAAA